MSFRDCKLKPVYRSGPDNILNDFYKPLFKCTKSYDRAVGFFSSEVLEANLKGILSLVKNGGRIRLVIGHPISEEEFSAIKYYDDYSSTLNDLNEKFNTLVSDGIDKKFNKLEVLAWLTLNNRLEVKFALRRAGMYHEKIGILVDMEGNTVCFQGSANETIYALTGNYNAESIMVFPSWEPAFEDYGRPCIDGFKSVWNNELENTVTLDMPSSMYEKLSERALKYKSTEEFIKQNSEEIYREYLGIDYGSLVPSIPDTLGGNKFELKKHQISSIKKWWSSDHKGILKLATGSGKTITSIAAAVKVYESRAKNGGKTFLLVSVPYQELASQWVTNLGIFNIHPVKCWDSKAKWERELESSLIKYNLGAIDFLAVVVVNRTMESSAFKEFICKLPQSEIMVIGDECHNHGSIKTNESLPNAHFRMGLSATPFRSDEDEIDTPFPDVARERILSYYKGIVASYSLGDAIDDGVLCEYEYHIIPVYLTEDEQEHYQELSADIGKLIAGGADTTNSSQLTLLCGKRSRLLGGAKNKLNELNNLLQSLQGIDKKGSLFYCGEGRSTDYATDTVFDEKIVEQVSSLLDTNGWYTSRFTSAEKGIERAVIMNEFKSGVIDGLVSMKVLDEGVDVPYCNKAFILASTRNPRQYVQRRGRVLRKAEGKDKATIYDFIILPLPTDGAVPRSGLDALIQAELERIDDFCLLAINRFDVEKAVDELGLRKEV